MITTMLEKMSHTKNANGPTPTDSAAALNGAMEFVEGCKLVDNNEIVCSDCRARAAGTQM